VETQPSAVRAVRGTRDEAALDVPVLAAPGAGWQRGWADRLAGLHPAVAFVLTLLAGLIVIAGLSIACGLVVTDVLERVPGIGPPDERVEIWLAQHRSASLTHASLIGSITGGGVVLPIVAGVTALVAVSFKRWRIAAFAVFALAVESGTYRITTLVVHSHRPRVARLETLDPNASFPSGHTAAALAVYGGLALLLTSRVENRAVRVVAWVCAIALTAFVAGSRMYRGMHHPLDVAGGLLIGVAALIVVVLACRTAGAVANSRT
jgi:undecaprenyl-diphosphatase